MSAATAVFTSIAANYLPKARVLARSVKQVAPDAQFFLMLVDPAPDEFDLDAEPFDAQDFVAGIFAAGRCRRTSRDAPRWRKAVDTRDSNRGAPARSVLASRTHPVNDQ